MTLARHCGEIARWAALVLATPSKQPSNTCAPDFRYRVCNGWLITYVSGSVIAGRPLEKGSKGSRMPPVTLLFRCGNRIAVPALARVLNCSRTRWYEAENPFWGALGSSAASQADFPGAVWRYPHCGEDAVAITARQG